MSKLVRYDQPRPPSIRERVREAIRAYWGPSFVSSDHSGWLTAHPQTSTGIQVSEWTALNLAGVFAATNLIAGDIASLPLIMYKRVGDNGKDRFLTHPTYRLIHDQPNPDMTSVVWRKTVQAHSLIWGNGYSWIRRNGGAQPIALEVVTPDRVVPFRAPNGDLQYRILNRGGADTIVDAADMIHIPGLGFNGITGYSVIDKARESIGLAMGAERFGGTFYGNGTTFGGIISSPGPRPSDEVIENDRRRLNSQHQGPDRAHKILALYGGATFQQIGIPPNAAQFLETRKFQVEEIARWFNLPPHKLGILDGSTRANIEQQTVDYYTTTLIPWLKTWEQELSIKLLASSERNIQFIEHNVDGLLRGDSASRGDFYAKQFNIGAITPNQIAASENRNPQPGGDRSFVPFNMVPLDKVDEWIDSQVDLRKAQAEQMRKPPEPKVVAAPPDPQKQREIEILTEERDAARKKAQDAEDAMDLAKSEADSLRVEWLKTQKALQDEEARSEAAEKQLRDACAREVVLTSERNDAVAGRVHFEQLNIEYGKALELMTSERDALKTVVAERDAVVDGMKADAIRATVEHEAQTRQLEAERAETAEKLKDLMTLQDQIIHTQQALRGVLLDAVARLVRKETARARKASCSPEKLSKWVEDFYPMHEDVCREELKPVVRAWLVAQGSDAPVDRVLDRLIPAYLDESTRQLRGILIDADHDSLGPALEKVLRRWEADRADATVDKLLREAA